MSLTGTTSPPLSTAGKVIDDAPPVSSSPKKERLDIEHVFVEDDPRNWSMRYKFIILAAISAASMIAGLGANIYNPSIAQVKSQLHASDQQVGLSLSLFIVIQGSFPLIWTAMSEIKGRKWVYLVSLVLSAVGCAVTATAKTIAVLIGMRCIQAAGSSAVLALGAATLADIFEPKERGTMMGVYYTAPLLGPSLGSIIGGALAQVWTWRATFWFLFVWSCICFVSFLFFRDTFRKERSLTYQAILTRVKKEQTATGNKRQTGIGHNDHSEEVKTSGINAKSSKPDSSTLTDNVTDVEAQRPSTPPLKDVNLSLTDLNPVTPILHVLRRLNNICILLPSGLLFAFSYCISYTCSLTLSEKYGYDALHIGLVLLSFGIGSVMGSVLGGRYSDRVLARLKEKNGGKSCPEMRLQSAKLAMTCFPPSVVAYGWFCDKHLHIAFVCVALFAAGFFSIAIYASTLTYIVDANPGRSSAAVATNSSIRGLSAFVATEIAVPVQNGIGDGGMYTLWAVVMVIAELMILLVAWKGGEWRERGETNEEDT